VSRTLASRILLAPRTQTDPAVSTGSGKQTPTIRNRHTPSSLTGRERVMRMSRRDFASDSNPHRRHLLRNCDGKTAILERVAYILLCLSHQACPE
jgi:hypothetical protein